MRFGEADGQEDFCAHEPSGGSLRLDLTAQAVRRMVTG